MVTLKEELLTEMSSTFDMTKIIWTLKNKSWAKWPTFIIFWEKKFTYCKKFLISFNKLLNYMSPKRRGQKQQPDPSAPA
jgi:hypothetical protein